MNLASSWLFRERRNAMADESFPVSCLDLSSCVPHGLVHDSSEEEGIRAKLRPEHVSSPFGKPEAASRMKQIEQDWEDEAESPCLTLGRNRHRQLLAVEKNSATGIDVNNADLLESGALERGFPASRSSRVSGGPYASTHVACLQERARDAEKGVGILLPGSVSLTNPSCRSRGSSSFGSHNMSSNVSVAVEVNGLLRPQMGCANSLSSRAVHDKTGGIMQTQSSFHFLSHTLDAQRPPNPQHPRGPDDDLTGQHPTLPTGTKSDGDAVAGKVEGESPEGGRVEQQEAQPLTNGLDKTNKVVTWPDMSGCNDDEVLNDKRKGNFARGMTARWTASESPPETSGNHPALSAPSWKGRASSPIASIRRLLGLGQADVHPHESQTNLLARGEADNESSALLEGKGGEEGGRPGGRRKPLWRLLLRERWLFAVVFALSLLVALLTFGLLYGRDRAGFDARLQSMCADTALLAGLHFSGGLQRLMPVLESVRWEETGVGKGKTRRGGGRGEEAVSRSLHVRVQGG